MTKRQSSNKPELGLNNDIVIARCLTLYVSSFSGRKNSFMKLALLNTVKL